MALPPPSATHPLGCAACRARAARFGRQAAGALPVGVICLACARAARPPGAAWAAAEPAVASSFASFAGLRAAPPRGFPLTTRQIAHRRVMLAHCERLRAAATVDPSRPRRPIPAPEV